MAKQAFAFDDVGGVSYWTPGTCKCGRDVGWVVDSGSPGCIFRAVCSCGEVRELKRVEPESYRITTGMVSGVTISFAGRGSGDSTVRLYGHDQKWIVPTSSAAETKLGTLVDVWRTPTGYDVRPRERWDNDPPHGCGACGCAEGAYHNNGCLKVAGVKPAAGDWFQPGDTITAATFPSLMDTIDRAAYRDECARVLDAARLGAERSRLANDRVCALMGALDMAGIEDLAERGSEDEKYWARFVVSGLEKMWAEEERKTLTAIRDDFDNLPDAAPDGIVRRP